MEIVGRKTKSLFRKEEEKGELSIYGIERLIDKGFFLADYCNYNVKFFDKETETSSVVYRSKWGVSSVRLLADESGFLTFENTKSRVCKSNFYFLNIASIDSGALKEKDIDNLNFENALKTNIYFFPINLPYSL